MLDVITWMLANQYTDTISKTFAGGLKYQGSKPTIADLPTASSANKGYVYTIVSNGHEWVSDGTQWIDLSADLDNKADRTELSSETSERQAADEVLQTNIDAKQNKLIAGTNITINEDEKTINAVDTVYSAGNGIDITNNIISINGVSGVAIYSNRISNANQWLTNGYVKTSAEIPTLNLPALCTGNDRWGVLLYIAENNENKAGLQQYFPIDGTYKGRVFYRSVTGYSAEIEPEFGEWKLVPWTDEKQDTLTAGTGIDLSNNNIKVTGVEYKNSETIQSNALKFVKLAKVQYEALTSKDADTLYIIIG